MPAFRPGSCGCPRNAQRGAVWSGGGGLPWRAGWETNALPGGRGFPKQLEPLYKGKCLIDIAAGLSDEFNSEGWSIDFEDETHAEPGGRQATS